MLEDYALPISRPTNIEVYYDSWSNQIFLYDIKALEKEMTKMSFYCDNHDYGNEGVSYSDHTETAEITVSTTGTDLKWPTSYTRQRYLDMLAAKQYVNDKYGWGGAIGVYDPKPAIKKFKDFVLHGFSKTRHISILTGDIDYYPDHVEENDITTLRGNEFPDLIKKVIFSGPCTIVIWNDDSKTIVKCKKGEKFDPEKGIAMAVLKKLFMGSSTRMSKWLDKVMKDGDIYVEESDG